MRPRLTITLALLLSALLVATLPRTASAAPARGTAAAPESAAVHGAASPVGSPAAAGARSSAAAVAHNNRNVCSLSGLVPAHGASCPAGGRLRRQWLGIPVLPDPVPVVKKVVGGVASTAIKAVALAAILGWVASGAESALKETANVIDHTTSPQLTSSWFSASYWRVAGIAALLTVPFLCAAAIHALVRSDLGLLTRAAFGYLPLSLLAVGIASQLTMLLLAGTDEMSAIVASASAHADSVFLSTTSVGAIAASVAIHDPFITFLAAILTVAATLALWLELLVRDAAVYVIVLMLPLFFAAMVWPARRTLAIRAIETLIALILSKFAIVAVLSLGGAALGHSTIPGAASVLTGGTLVLLAAFTPWALLRMLPLHELASAAAGGLSQAPRQTLSTVADTAMQLADSPALLGAGGGGRRSLRDAEPSNLGGGGSSPTPRSATEDGPQLAVGHGRSEPVDADVAEPVDADVAEPVRGAMSGAGGAADQIGPPSATSPGSAPDGVPGPAAESVPSSAPDAPSGSAPDGGPGSAPDAASGSAPDRAPGSEVTVGAPGPELAVNAPDGDLAGSATDQPGADAGSIQRWPEPLAFPDGHRDGGDDPKLTLGNDMLELADDRRSLAAAADDEDEV